MQIFKSFTFDSAHFLPHVPEGHKCKAIHGHTYRMIVYIEGPLDQEIGWVADFADIKKAIEPIENPSKPDKGTPASPEAAPKSPAEAMAKFGRLV